MNVISNGQLVLIVYYVSINVCAYLLMYKDKQSAINNTNRIPEKNLFKISLLGGSTGIMLAMITLQHKIKKQQFQTKIPRDYLVIHMLIAYLYLFNVQ